jgi:hypothetical protein
MESTIFIGIILIHFLADFGLQTNDQAVNKSSSNTWLTYHVGVYSIVWLVAAYCFLFPDDPLLSLAFSMITYVLHFVTDWITSRIGKPFWEKKDLHNGFTVVGFDQVLHYIQLVLTYEFLYNN